MANGMPVFPGSEPVTFVKSSDIESVGYNEIQIHISTHTGTHIDCGRHLINNGFETNSASLEKFYGKGLVIDCRKFSSKETITRSHLRLFESSIKQAEFVLLHTGWSRLWGTSQYFNDFPVPDAEAAEYLTEFTLKGVGIDTLSFDPIISTQLSAHMKLLSKEILLIENLTNIEKLPDEGFMFCCFPLRIVNGDGSPVRAVGIIENIFPINANGIIYTLSRFFRNFVGIFKIPQRTK
jgi:kynurenine formamidase